VRRMGEAVCVWTCARVYALNILQCGHPSGYKRQKAILHGAVLCIKADEMTCLANHRGTGSKMTME
jgi:hypothetical protein